MLLNVIQNQRPDIEKSCLYIKDPYETKYQLLITGWEKVGIKKVKNPKAFIAYSQTIDNVYENLADYNPTKKRKVLIVFDRKIAEVKAKKKLRPTIAELFLRGRKLNISLVFISQIYFKVLKTIGRNVTHYFIMKIPHKTELQKIALNHSSDNELKDFMKVYKDYTKETFSFSVNDANLPSDNPVIKYEELSKI